MLLRNTQTRQQEAQAAREGASRPKGWLAGLPWLGAAAGNPQTDHVVSESPVAALAVPTTAIIQPAPEPSITQGVPVPTVFLGVLPTPIPPGRPTLDAQALVRSLEGGVLPSDALLDSDREVWRAASRITDSISSFNICQAQQLAGRKLILTERGVAEQLARGTIQMVPVPGSTATATKKPSSLNPFAPLQRLLGRLAEGQRMSQRVQQRADAWGGQLSGRGEGGRTEGAEGAGVPGAATAASAASPPATDPSASAEQERPQPQYSLQGSPVRRVLAPSAPPQLAWVPLRVALQLLRSLPQHFVLLQSCGQEVAAARGGGQAWQTQGQQQQQGAKAGQAGTFNTATSPGEVQVHIIPGLHVRQLSPDGTPIEFTPAFLCASQVQALWRDLREISGGAMLMHRRVERAMMRRRLENAVAMIAGARRGGGGGGGAQIGISAQDEGNEEGEGAADEPPEVSDFIRELGGSLSNEQGPRLAASAGGGRPPGLSRLAALFACGVVSLTASGLSWAGNTVDWAVMATPLGPRLLGVPGAAIQQCSLKSVVNGMHYYNRSMALMNMLRSTAEHHAAMPLHHDTTESSGSGSDSDAREAGVAMRTAAARGRLQEGVQQYCKTLAASALWLALSAKVMAEDGGLGSQPVSRRLAKSFMQHEMPSEAGMDMASVNGGVLHSQIVASLSSGRGDQTLEERLAEGLPLLEHNGFQFYFDGSLSAAPESVSSDGMAGGGGGLHSVAAAVSQHCTGQTVVGLGTLGQDSDSGKYSMLMRDMHEPPPGGRGLILVGDLDLKPRPRGKRSTGRTDARFLVASVDDGCKLL